MRRGIVPEFRDARVPVEHRLNDATLNASPATVNQPHLVQTGRSRGLDVIGDDAGDIARRERVQVELGFDWDMNRIHESPWLPPASPNRACPSAAGYGFEYSAVTTVLIPPRTEKSPTTVIRLGRSASTRTSRISLVTCS